MGEGDSDAVTAPAPRPRRRRRRDRWAPLVAALKRAWFLGWLALAASLTWGVLRVLDHLNA